MIASALRRLDVAEYLLDHGADVRTIGSRELIHGIMNEDVAIAHSIGLERRRCEALSILSIVVSMTILH